MYINNFLENIVRGDNEFCALCYKTLDDERTDLSDEVILLEKSSQKFVIVSEILSYVLGEDVFRDVSEFQSICLQCVTSAVNSYKFIKETKDNVEYVSTAVQNLLDCFHEENIPDLDCYDSVFVPIHPTDLNIGIQYYDNIGPLNSKVEALEKFLASANLPMKQEFKTPPKLNLYQLRQNIQYVKPRSEIISKEKKKSIISTVDMIHNGDMSALICKECLKEFPSVSNIRSHFLRVHAPKQYKCPDCPKSYGTISFLRAHQADSHIHLICSECGKTFTNLQTFKTHERSHYLRIVCADCGRLYKNQNTYKKHLDNNVCQTPVRHSPADAKFTCDYCNKKYTQKISLRVHIQYEHLNYKYHECKWCNKKFWCQARLKAHIVKHTKEKNFICTICSGKFVTKESLLYHTRIHTGERPYPCPFCDSKFLSASRRQAHLRSHHTDPTIECDLCHGKFKTISQLIKHKYIHEQSKPIENASTDNFENNLDMNKTVLIQKHPKGRQSSLLNFDDAQDQKVVYNIIEHENVYGMQTDSNDVQQTVYLEMTEDGQYNIKVPENV